VFEDVPQEVLDALPRELAEKYTAFPIKRERVRLHVAMKDPNDMNALDELRFIVGLDIRPYIASEMRIVFAMEKYYGIKRDLRYVAVKGAETTFDDTLAAKHAPAPPAGGPAPMAPPAPIEEEEAYLGDESQTDIYGAPPPFAVEEPAPPVAAAPAPAAPAVRAAPVARDPYEVLAAPSDREQIASALIEIARRVVSRAVLLQVKGEVVSGWKASGEGLTDGSVSQLSVTLAEPSLFKDVVEDKAFYKGPVLQVPQNNRLLVALGGAYPQEAVAYPLVIKGKVVGVLYGDNGQGAMITGDVGRLASLMVKASMSLEILILRNKILSDAV
jgi:hypothetical protein